MIIPRFPFITRSGSFRAPPGRHRCEWLGPHLVVWRCSLSVPGARTSSPTDLPLSRKSTDLGVSENGGTPIAGWFMSWKILLKWMIWIDLGDIPIFGHLNFFPPSVNFFPRRKVLQTFAHCIVSYLRQPLQDGSNVSSVMLV